MKELKLELTVEMEKKAESASTLKFNKQTTKTGSTNSNQDGGDGDFYFAEKKDEKDAIDEQKESGKISPAEAKRKKLVLQYGDAGDKNRKSIYVKRVWETEKSTISIFVTSDGEVSGYMLEPAGPSTAVANQDQRIPEGEYSVSPYSSKKYPDNFILHNAYVSKERKILIHKGNYPGNTEGCVMPGTSRGVNFVGGSAGKFKELRKWIKSQPVPVKLYISDPISPHGVQMNFNLD